MLFGENFPYTNFHDLNLDWIIKTMRELNDKFDEAISGKIKFADPLQWDITKQYEALTIVLNEEVAYLSLQPVPSGTNITNTDYWQPVFDMSTFYQMIEDIDEELNDKIDDVEDELNDKIDEVEDGLEDEITALDSKTVKNNSTKHILFCGDSYTTWYSNKLFNEFVNAAGLVPSQCHNVAVTGAGFTIGTVPFIDQLQGYTGNKNEITDIIVCGGINDALLEYATTADTSALQTAILNFVTYAHTYYPNARLHIAYVGGTMPSSQYYETLHPARSQEWALWAYTVFAGGNGFNVLKAWNAIHTSKNNYHTDGLHPSELYGTVAIGQAVAGAFNENAIITSRPMYIYTLQASGKNIRGISSFIYTTNDIITISVPDSYFQITNGESIGSDQWYEVLTFDQYYVREPHFFSAMVTISGFNSNSTPRQVPASFMVRDGKMSIKVFSLSGSSYETLTAGSFATVSFYSLNDIQCPIWEVN